MSLHQGGDFVYGHSEANVRLVGTVVVHGVVPGHARNRIRNLHTYGIPEHLPHHALEGVEHVFLLHERHFTVYLGEFRLAVGTEVLVTEAAHYLEVPVVAGDHKQLLEGLRGLRKGIELARVHPGRYHEIPCSLRCGFDEIRGLDFHESLLVKV